MQQLLKAINFATVVHNGQIRRISGKPYITHAIKVAERISEVTHRESILVAAILHDVLEDTTVTKTELELLFGAVVADLVEEVSNDTKLLSFMGKEAYQLRMLPALSDSALLIKLADITDNLQDAMLEKSKERTKRVLQTLQDNIKQRNNSLIHNMYGNLKQLLEI